MGFLAQGRDTFTAFTQEANSVRRDANGVTPHIRLGSTHALERISPRFKRATRPHGLLLHLSEVAFNGTRGDAYALCSISPFLEGVSADASGFRYLLDGCRAVDCPGYECSKASSRHCESLCRLFDSRNNAIKTLFIGVYCLLASVTENSTQYCD